MMRELPPGWEWVRLGDLGVEVRGQVKPEPGVTYDLYSVPAFPTRHPERIDGASIKSGKRPVEEGDVLLCKINPRINRVWVVAESDGFPQIASTEYLILRLHDPHMAPAIRWYMSSPRFRDWIKLSVEGATGSHTRAKSGPILDQEIPLSPTEEQKRIVAAVEQHFSRLDAADSALEMARVRCGHLLECALDAAIRQYPTQEFSFSSFLTQKLSNGRSVPTANGGGSPVLRLTCLQNGLVNINETKLGDFSGVDHQKYQIEPDDFLISRGNGSIRLVGIGGLVLPKPPPVAFPDTLIRARVDRRRLRPEFLRLIWNSKFVRRQLEAQARTTAGIYKVNQTMIGKVSFPTPSPEDQDRLVQELDQVREVVVGLEAEVSLAQERSRILRRSILADAFSGRLIPQDPTDEPASALLERIAASRQSA